MYIHIGSQFAIKPVYTILNRCNYVMHMADMYLTIQLQHNTVVHLTLNFHPKGESSALTCFFVTSCVDTHTHIDSTNACYYLLHESECICSVSHSQTCVYLEMHRRVAMLTVLCPQFSVDHSASWWSRSKWRKCNQSNCQYAQLKSYVTSAKQRLLPVIMHDAEHAYLCYE
jgi:hypothetical protein